METWRQKMYKIVERKELAPSIFLMEIEAQRVTKAANAIHEYLNK